MDDPHAAIDGVGQGEIVNLADRRAARSRGAQLDLLSSLGPDRIVSEFARLEGPARQAEVQPLLPHPVMPAHHDVRPEDVVAHRLPGIWPRRPTGVRRIFPSCCLRRRGRADRPRAGDGG